jgi:hypothetical protein
MARTPELPDDPMACTPFPQHLRPAFRDEPRKAHLARNERRANLNGPRWMAPDPTCGPHAFLTNYPAARFFTKHRTTPPFPPYMARTIHIPNHQIVCKPHHPQLPDGPQIYADGIHSGLQYLAPDRCVARKRAPSTPLWPASRAPHRPIARTLRCQMTLWPSTYLFPSQGWTAPCTA